MPPIAVMASKSAPALAEIGAQYPMIKSIARANSHIPVTILNQCGKFQFVNASTCILDPVTFP